MKQLSYEDIASYWYEQDGILKNDISLSDKVADIVSFDFLCNG